MLLYNDCRPGNLVHLDGKLIEIASVTRRSLSLRHPLSPEMEHLHRYDFSGISGCPVDMPLLRLLHFVDYGDGKAIEHESGDMYEVTDGRVILRLHATGVSVFTPIDMPFATPDFPLHMYYIAQVQFLHQLQNLYWDLFGVELDIHSIWPQEEN